jgi:hypothetical protein
MQLFMSPGMVTSERRKRSRRRPPSLVYVELASQNGGMMRDLSEEGFAVRVMMPLRVGDKTTFSFSLNEFIHIVGEGAILWVEDKGRVAGVKFTQISSTARAQIHGWLNGSADRVPQKRTAIPEAPTLEQLREELRSSPPRPTSSKPTETPVSPAAPATASATTEEVASASVAAESPLQSKSHEEDAKTLIHQTPTEAAAQVEASATPESVATASDVSQVRPLEETESAEQVSAPETQSESTPPVESEVTEAAPQVSASEPLVEEGARALAEQVVSGESTPAHTETLRPLTTELRQAAAGGTPSTAALAETEAAKERIERSSACEPETANVSALFTPVPELVDQQEQAAPPTPMWRADGQIPAANTLNSGPAAPAASESLTNLLRTAEPPQRVSEPEAGRASIQADKESNASPKTAPDLPRLALRLNAADYVKQGFPFAAGPMPARPEPVSEERPKRFWAPVPPEPAEERPPLVFQETRPAAGTVDSAEAQEPIAHTAGEHQEDAPILPDISSVLIQPSGTARPEHAQYSSVPEKLRPRPQGPPKRKESWADRFTLPRAVGIMLLLAIVVGLYVNRQQAGQALIWLGEFISRREGAQTQRPVPVQTTENNQTPGTSSSAAGSEAQHTGESVRLDESQASDNRASQNQKKAASAAPAGSNAQAPPLSKPKNVTPPMTQGTSISRSAPVTEPSTEPGQAEYLQAMQISRGKNPSYSQGAAVKLLWAAVEKGNPSAELALADMYWHGKGVPRNCDQTRILLTAASRKGSAEAQRKLQEFQQEGCE